MSVQFGRWSFDGMPPLLDFLERVNTMLAPYGPDNSSSYHKDGVSVLYHAFHTTKESRRETQPDISRSGTVITWDGRLDNRAELIHQFSGSLSIASADVSILSAAYERWGTASFAKLMGDWALSIWNPNERSLILAKDPIGTRHLYYSVENDQVTWSTILDPLVLLAGRPLALDEEYIAGWFSFFPAARLTPYVGIDSVPPSCFVCLERGKRTITKYWDFDPGKRIRYRTDAEYEKHFRAVFGEAVRRRLRSDTPILAELSGGMDSSSIVCVADTIIAQGAAETPRLDTLSYYNDLEPNWNERPYFTKVEDKRGRAGCHIDVSTLQSFRFEFESDRFAATPGSGGQTTEASRQFATCIASQGNRVVLSGVGGDEITGGVPTPTPELMDLLARARLRSLARQLKLWALNKRKPWFLLFFEAARGFFPLGLVGLPKQSQPVSWLNPDFVKSQRAALTGYPSRVRVLGPLPNFQESISTLDSLRRQLACSALSSIPLFDKRYPYLDRELLEFIYAIPREQLVRPGQRRSLMRRALAGIVPEEILNRRRKAFVTRSPMTVISNEYAGLISMSQDMISASLGIVDAKAFCESAQKARQGQAIRIVVMMRTLALESWLRTIGAQGLLRRTPSKIAHRSTAEREKERWPRFTEQ
jgi:asparagine synthase (glutamine-hydrolysing)